MGESRYSSTLPITYTGLRPETLIAGLRRNGRKPSLEEGWTGVRRTAHVDSLGVDTHAPSLEREVEGGVTRTDSES